MELNEKQKIAAYEHNEENILVSAAAGSGKTRVLVERIMDLITKKGKKLDKMLIMTFTKKATYEMKARIKKNIDELIANDQSNENLIEASSLIQNANISTIDAFCKKILDENYSLLDEKNSLYSDFDPSYRMADEKELSILYDDVLDKLLEEKYDDKKYKNLFDCYYENNNDDLIREMLMSGFNFLSSITWPKEYLEEKIKNFEVESKKYYEEYLRKSIKSIKNEVADYLKTDNLSEMGNYLNDLIEKKREKNDKKSKEDLIKWQSVADGFFSDYCNILDSIKESFDNVININDINNINNICKNSEKIIKNMMPTANSFRGDENFKGVNEIFRNMFVYLFGGSDEVGKLRELSDILNIENEALYNKNEKLFLQLLYDYYLLVIEAKKKKNILSVGDFANLALDILYDKRVTENGDVTREISEYAKEIGKDYDLIFVDEYQDTNYIQEKILAALTNNFEVDKNKNQNVFFVGDIKQSIYGFRNAEPKIFTNRFNAYKNNEVKDSVLITLDQNYRSSKEVINYVNYLFSNIMFENEDKYWDINYARDGMLYPSEENAEKETTEDSKVELYILSSINNASNKDSDNATTDENEKNISLDNQNDKDTIASKNSQASQDNEKEKNSSDDENGQDNNDDKQDIDFKKEEAKFVAEKIEDLVVNKGYSYKQIAILMRSAKNAPIFVEELSKRNIPAYSEEKKGFFNRFEIKLMISLLNVIDNPLQDIPLSAILTSKLFSIDNDELAFIRMFNRLVMPNKKYMLYNAIKLLLKVVCEKDEDLEKKDCNTINYNKDNAKNKNSEDNKNTKTEETNEEMNKDSIGYEEYKIESEDQKEGIIEIDIVDTFEKYGIDKISLINKLTYFINVLDELTFKTRYLSISELINYIYEKLDLKNIISSMEEGILRVANLNVFYETARAYENTSYVGLFNFLRYIERIIDRESDQGQAKLFDENDNVVNIMTIHASKGLEFPVVFLCNTDKSYIMDSNNQYLYDREMGIAFDYINYDKKYKYTTPKKKLFAEKKKQSILQEEMRMLYVALTRAKEKLIITGHSQDKGNVYTTKRLNEFIALYEISQNNKDIVNDLNKIEFDKETIENVESARQYLSLITSFYPFGADYIKFENIIINEEDANENATENEIIIDDELVLKSIDVLKADNEKNSYELSNEFENVRIGVSDYKYKDLQNISPKFSVSQIKKDAYDNKYARRKKAEKEIDKETNEELDKNVAQNNYDVKEILEEENIIVRNDNFYEDISVADDKNEKINITNGNEEEELSGALLGTAYHKYMQFYDYDKNEYVCPNEIVRQGEKLCSECVDKNRIEKFLENTIGNKMANAFKNGSLYREQKFMKLFSQNEIDEFLTLGNIENENAKNYIASNEILSEKNVIIQGIIDAFFIEKDEKGNEYVVLVDYKTDGISKSNIGNREKFKLKLIDDYAVQLKIYAKVLEDLLSLPVKQIYIYSFALDEEIELD